MLRLVVVWLHVAAAAAWVGGLLHVSHLVGPAAARGGRESLNLLTRARTVAWAAWALLVVTGIENLRRVGLASPWLAAKLVAVIALLALAAHRDFAVLPRAVRAVEGGGEPAAALSGVRALDRVVLLLALAVLFLAVGVARGR
jgi:putative copper export protein